MNQSPRSSETIGEENRQLESVEQLADDLVQKIRCGEKAAADDLEEQFPELSGDIDGLVKTLSVLEEASFRHRVSHSYGSVVDSSGRRLRSLGGFRLIREISRGGMGIVYEAAQESLDRRVAVKVLPPSPLLTDVERSRFEREGAAIARLHHSNIVPVFGTGDENGISYCVMQYIEGYGLDRVLSALRARMGKSDVLSNQKKKESIPSADEDNLDNDATSDDLVQADFPVSSAVNLILGAELKNDSLPNLEVLPHQYYRRVASLAADIADGLDHAHQQGVLHRDIKPANLLFDSDGVIWITDFGLAKLHDRDSLTNKGSLLGTIRYAPREQFSGESDNRSDVYSLGMTLYELCTLEPAFKATDQRELMRHVTNDTPPHPRSINPDIPRDLETIILKAIAPERENRYQSARDLSADLENFVEDRPVKARRQTPLQLAFRWCRRHRLETATASFALLMLLLFSATATLLYVREARRLRESIASATEARQSLDQLYDSYLPDWTTSSTVSAHGSISVSPESARLFEDLVEIYDRLAQRNNQRPEKAAVLDSSAAMRRVGLIYHRLGAFDQSKQSYGQAAEHLASYFHRDPSPEVQLEYARTLNELGAVYWTQRHVSEAYRYHERALKLLDSTSTNVQADSGPELQSELAKTLYLIGRRGRGQGGGIIQRPEIEEIANTEDEPRQKGNPAKIDRAVRILEDLMERKPVSTEHLHLLALCYREQSNGILSDDGNPVDQSIVRAIDALEYLVKLHPEHPGYRYSLCTTLQWVKVNEGQADAAIDTAVDRYQKSVGVAEQLSLERPDEWIYLASQVQGHLQLSDIKKRGGRLEEALASGLRAVETSIKLAEDYPDCDSFAYWVGLAHLKQGHLLRRTSQAELALQSYDHAMRDLEFLVDKRDEPEWNRVIFRNISRVWRGRRIVLSDLGRREEAKVAGRKETYYLERSRETFQ